MLLLEGYFIYSEAETEPEYLEKMFPNLLTLFIEKMDQCIEEKGAWKHYK